MTNETRNRIEAYKKALPDMKERVAATAFLMVMSVMMMASASFAWLTISRRPEVTGVSTSVTANGNLEIALASSDNAPEESQVGDSSTTKGQSITASNITWGNLVNLSDPSYGLENLTLRPAQLNQSALLDSPLYGAVYQNDGRVEELDSSFAYSIWNADTKVFEVSNGVGVRAISSTKLGEVASGSTALLVHNKRTETEKANLTAGAAYSAITNNKAWMDSLAVVMGTFMTAEMNAGQGDASLTNPTMEQEDVKNLAALFEAFVNVYDLQFEAMTKLANYQLFLKNGAGGDDSTPYTEKTVEYIKNATESSLKSEGLQVSGLDQAKKDYPNLVDGYEKLQELTTQGTVKWNDSGLNAVVNSLMNTGGCTLDGTPVNNIGVSNAMGYLDGNTHTAVITNGVLKNFEEMNGTRCDVRGLTVSAKVKRMGITIPASISADIKTDAPVPSLFSKDLDAADKKYPTTKVLEVAQDTYGLAVDLWVRTNVSGSYLTLEGNILTKSDYVRATGKDSSGNTVDLYTLERTAEETGEDGKPVSVTYTLNLYKIETTNNGETVTTWYNADSHATVTLEDGEEKKIKNKMTEVITVIGYEGENRVWEDANAWESNSQLSLDSTTQGSGSCYVYYADTPEDQARSLKLLESMNVAFIDDTGTLLATAIMDTERYYAENGRVTVPLVLKSDSLNIGTDSKGNKMYAIAPLVQNEPTRITAIVYLDGTKLSNQEVLAASDIQGKLNVQFGSSVTLSHADDETLLNATRSVSATVDKNKFSYDASIGTDEKPGSPMTTKVTVTVDGDQPEEVKAFFIRQISSTQGSRESVMTFTSQDDGTWIATHTFTAPGNYILRSVELGGQTYDLETCPTVTIEGFTVESLICTQADGNRHINVMTDATSYEVDLKLKFATDNVKAMPAKVQGRFLRDGDGTAVNINFTYNSTDGFWYGTAKFISSGNYTLEYLVLYTKDTKLDTGEYAQLDAGLIHTATVNLGMKTAVYTDSPTSFKYNPEETEDNKKNLYMKVKIMDNTGQEIQGLQGAHLYYLMEGSSVVENGFDAPLTWNAESGYYTCTFNTRESDKTKIGVFKFSHVIVGSNTLTYAEDSPLFRIMSPEPPSYVGFEKNPYLYSATANIVMKTDLSYSSTATVAALIRNTDDGKEYEVQGTKPKDENNIQTWHFLIPTSADGKQDGNWELEEIRVWNYYDAAGNYIEAEVDKDGKLVKDGERDDPLVFNKENTEKMKGNVTKAVNTLTVTVNLPENYDTHLGNSATSGSDVSIATATATFLDTQTVNVPTVTIVDFEGDPVGTKDADGNFNSLVSEVKFVYDYDGKSYEYGGYTSDNVVATKAALTVNLTSADGENFSQSGTANVQYAGKYVPTLYYKVNGVLYSKTTDDMKTTSPTFAVWSKKPSLTVKSASTNNGAWAMNGTSFTAHTGSGTGSSAVTSVKNTYDSANNNLTVYIAATYWGGAKLGRNYYGAGIYYDSNSQNGTISGGEEKVAERTCPKVVLQLSNAGKTFNTASYSLAGDNSLSISGTITRGQVTTGTFDTTSHSIGSVSGTWGIDLGWLGALGARCTNRTVFGSNKTISTITMTDASNNSYTVTLDKALTINNPY